MTMQLKELEADIRNKLSMPLVVLDMVREGKIVSEEKIDLAMKELRAIVEIFESVGN